MKLDLLDIETQYINNRNLNYAKKHYIELEDGIIRLEITHIDKINSTFIEMESIIAGYENETSLTINDEGNYEHSSCTCSFHNSMEPCGHVWQLAKYVMDNNLEAPYEYEKDEVREETIEKYFEKRSKIIQETINNEWFKEILKDFGQEVLGLEDDAFLTGQDSTIIDLSGDKAKILRQGSITREDILAKIPAIPFKEV